jgi:hypothetical protein
MSRGTPPLAIRAWITMRRHSRSLTLKVPHLIAAQTSGVEGGNHGPVLQVRGAVENPGDLFRAQNSWWVYLNRRGMLRARPAACRFVQVPFAEIISRRDR